MLTLKEKLTLIFLLGGLAGGGFSPAAGRGEEIVTLPPPPARLLSPRAGEVISGRLADKRFFWTVVTQARRYHLELARDRGFFKLLRNVYPEKNSYTFSSPLHEGTYFWRVSSVNARGLEGRHSPVRFFIYPSPDEAEKR